MVFKSRHLSPLGYTIYALVGTILEQAALVVIVRWGLPHLNINIPWWGLAILMVALLLYSCFTYRMGRQVLLMKPMVSPESIIDSEGTVATPLDPKGYVRVKGELWKASAGLKLEVGDEIVVTGIDGIKLIVAPKRKSRAEPPSLKTKHRGF